MNESIIRHGAALARLLTTLAPITLLAGPPAESHGQQAARLNSGWPAAAITQNTVSFGDPYPYTDKVMTVSFACDGDGNNCTGSFRRYTAGNTHTGVDWDVGTREGEPVYASTYATVANLGYLNDAGTCGYSVHLKHLTTRGEVIYTKYGHLTANSTSHLSLNRRVGQGQLVGAKGNTGLGETDTVRSSHLHFETGYRERCEPTATSEWPTTRTRLIDPTGLLANPNYQVLIPYFSFSASSPGMGNYDVYGLADRPLYASITLTPPAARVFTNIGVGGRLYGSEAEIRDIFLNPTESFAAGVSRTLAGNRRFPAGDYRFFAWSSSFGDGYPIKLAILPDAVSTIVDNDGPSGYQGDETGAETVAGYYLSAKLFPGASPTNYAKWSPSLTGDYEVWVHVPEGARSRSVSYGISTDGTRVTPADPIDQAANNDRWVQLTAGSARFFALARGGYVELSNASVRSRAVTEKTGVDAVKFLYRAAAVACVGCGAPPDVASKFIAAYNLEGAAVLGHPTANVQTFSNPFYSPSITGYYQDFGGTWTRAVIDYLPGAAAAYSVKYGFSQLFYSQDAQTGQPVYRLVVAPMANERRSDSLSAAGTEYTWQPFLKGGMYFYHRSPIGGGLPEHKAYTWGYFAERYNREGGRSSPIGLPLLPPVQWGDYGGWVWWYQWFEKGFVWEAATPAGDQVWTYAFRKSADVYREGIWSGLGWVRHK